jgi:hypothetical protein
LTTLVEIKKDKNNLLNGKIIGLLKKKFLDSIKMDDKSYEFIINHEKHGLFSFYKHLSNYINKNITDNTLIMKKI